MSPQPITQNTLFYGDNLTILREYIPDESVDLIYLDPPFNSNRNYNVLFKDESGSDSEAQITAFEDTWHWNRAAEQTYHDLVTDGPEHVAKMIGALRDFVGTNEMMAYLVMMASRLVELHRVLKATGSLYLHCDPTSSHYLKIILDTIFGPDHFLNEITWKRTTAHNDPKRYGRIQDRILFYAKSSNKTFHHAPGAYSDKQLSRYKYQDERGPFRAENLTAPYVSPTRTIEWRGTHPGSNRQWRFSLEELEQLYGQGRILLQRDGRPRKDGYKVYLEETEGPALQDIWTDIGLGPTAGERLGYPTQKPLSLLERITAASSNPNDIILDPFCGCGTAIAAAQKLGRKWIGIDITHLSIALQKYRLEAMFPGIQFAVVGEPEDVGAARHLAQSDRYQFQWWALSLIRAKPLGGQQGSKTGKKGSDKGIDGVITFIDDNSDKPKRVLVQVKSGHVKSADVRDLVGAVQRENAAIGVFITLESPSQNMATEAISAGYYHASGWHRDYPRIQILTIDELLHGATVQMPPQYGTFKQAKRVREVASEQPELEMVE
ncbi:MAG TPA: DNA methyltransferase [Ktedonobacteraceae bacterium]|nr:DNA methyltransferase [Ktedonobacteraceae bacterium]